MATYSYIWLHTCYPVSAAAAVAGVGSWRRGGASDLTCQLKVNLTCPSLARHLPVTCPSLARRLIAKRDANTRCPVTSEAPPRTERKQKEP